MKEVLAEYLEVGDLIHYNNVYWEVVEILVHHARLKYITLPNNRIIAIRGWHHILKKAKVLLLCRDGKVV